MPQKGCVLFVYNYEISTKDGELTQWAGTKYYINGGFFKKEYT